MLVSSLVLLHPLLWTSATATHPSSFSSSSTTSTTTSPRTSSFVPKMSTASDDTSSSSSSSLDQFWQHAAMTVMTGDFEAYRQLYHPDAVLVKLDQSSSSSGEESTTSDASGNPPGTCRPIQQALDEWKDGFEATAAGKQTVRLDFRFGQRLQSPTTAHETGIFCYQQQTLQDDPNGSHARTDQVTTVYMHFESLLIKKEEPIGWQWMMEYQKQRATKEEWDALSPAG